MKNFVHAADSNVKFYMYVVSLRVGTNTNFQNWLLIVSSDS